MPLIPTGTVRAAFEDDERFTFDERLAEALRELNVPAHRLGLIDRLLAYLESPSGEVERRARLGLSTVVSELDRGSTGVPLHGDTFRRKVERLLALIERSDRSEESDEFELGIDADDVVELFQCAALDGEGGAAPLVGSMEGDAPLVHQKGVLHLHQTAALEADVAEQLDAIVGSESGELDDGLEEAIEAVLGTWPYAWLEADAHRARHDRERKRDALETLVEGRLNILTGRAGTGKTTLVFALLRALVRSGNVSPGDVELAAPTGKAAARLREAIDEQREAMDERHGDWETKEALAWDGPIGEPRTLHRLLEYSPYHRTFRRNEGRPLEAELIVVDEASMVDLELMEALTAAVPDDARLLLVGDSGQLPAVQAGAVFHELSRPSEASERFGRRIVELERVYRTSDVEAECSAEGAGLDDINRAIRESGDEADFRIADPEEMPASSDDPETTIWPRLALDDEDETVAGRSGAWFISSEPSDARAEVGDEASLREGDDPGGDRLEAFLESWWSNHYGYLKSKSDDSISVRADEDFEHLSDSDTGSSHTFKRSARRRLEELFDHLERAQLLTLTRRKVRGAHTIDRHMHDRYVVSHDLDDPHRFERGEPVIVTENDYETNVFNGQQGIVLYTRRPEEGRRSGQKAKKRIVLRDETGGFRDVHISRIRDKLDHAYALTVHKSQGSEYEHVGVLLPELLEASHRPDTSAGDSRLHPLVTREMLYTAVSRAERSVVVFGHPRALEAGVARGDKRYSGVATRLSSLAAR